MYPRRFDYIIQTTLMFIDTFYYRDEIYKGGGGIADHCFAYNNNNNIIAYSSR